MPDEIANYYGRASNFYTNMKYHFFMCLCLTTLIAILLLNISETQAISVSYKEKLCERNFYGSNYKPYLEKTCGLLWSKWTYDILNTYE